MVFSDVLSSNGCFGGVLLSLGGVLKLATKDKDPPRKLCPVCIVIAN